MCQATLGGLTIPVQSQYGPGCQSWNSIKIMAEGRAPCRFSIIEGRFFERKTSACQLLTKTSHPVDRSRIFHHINYFQAPMLSFWMLNVQIPVSTAYQFHNDGLNDRQQSKTDGTVDHTLFGQLEGLTQPTPSEFSY